MFNVIKYIEGNFYYYLSKIGLGYDPIEKISQKRETIFSRLQGKRNEETKNT